MFSDLSHKEFEQTYLVKNLAAIMGTDKLPKSNYTGTVATGISVDWRTKGAVTPVKNQGSCGSCWTFSTSGAVEGANFLKGHGLVSLSEQYLVSCEPTMKGCNGGWPASAITWMSQTAGGAMYTEASYPYASGNKAVPACSTSGKKVGATIAGATSLAANEATMASWVQAHGPISVSVDATSWNSYKSGIMTTGVSKSIDHCVLAVGFNTAYNPPYWIIKNSWSTQWGESGYIRLKYGANECLVGEYGVYATVK